ncbi:uncharacterized protein K02A2.6-like [Brassica napus]|uniref:uncharacterized protein K02A2.6-like n=1 Tax=Brassica napus TaxID=3708 RepID=UPI000BBEC361|nr:uncharacterized protein K02A2.6-like [Brassica napus]
MDIVGKFLMAPGQNVFLLIVADYFSKWIEAEALSKITDLQIRKFIWTHVITRFEVPEKIVTDNGPQFTSHNFKEFCKDWGIRFSFATPRHPQSNGQAESTNKIVVNMLLKKRLGSSQGNLAEELHGVLWAYQTTPKTSTQETPYALVHGAEVIIPTEMHVKTTVSGTTSQEENHELMSLSLDLLDEKREAARLRNWSYQQEVANTYNKKVKTITFQQGDWVLRRADKTTGRLTPGWEGPYKLIGVWGAGAYRLQDTKGSKSAKVRESSVSLAFGFSPIPAPSKSDSGFM